MCQFRCKKILKGSFQPKLKVASFWPFNARSKVPTAYAEAVIHDHCTGIVKKKIDQCQPQ